MDSRGTSAHAASRASAVTPAPRPNSFALRSVTNALAWDHDLGRAAVAAYLRTVLGWLGRRARGNGVPDGSGRQAPGVGLASRWRQASVTWTPAGGVRLACSCATSTRFARGKRTAAASSPAISRAHVRDADTE